MTLNKLTFTILLAATAFAHEAHELLPIGQDAPRAAAAAPAPAPAPDPGPAPGPMPTIPSGTVPAACLGMKINKQYGPLLDCYLNHADNTLVAHFINRRFGSQWLSWRNWPPYAKTELAAAFSATIAWWDGGMVSYQGPQAPDVPPNMAEAQVYHGVHGQTVLDENTIWMIYKSRIAMLLAAEIYSWVPWSVKSYLTPTDSSAFSPLFSERMAGKAYTDSNGTQVFLGRGPIYSVTPANPLMVLKFLKTNNLIGATREETINRVLNWSRWNLAHMYGEYTSTNYYHYWKYWGAPPVARMLEGTITSLPGLPSDAYNPLHWTQGCYGTTAFLIELFQTVNIPVKLENVGWHAAPRFLGERKYMTHGDDPYTDFAKSNRPVTAFMIDAVKFASWYPANDPAAGDVNVTRGVMEDNILYPSNALVTLYLRDVQEGRTRAESTVYSYYKKWYTVAELEQKGLWRRLEAVAGTWQ